MTNFHGIDYTSQLPQTCNNGAITIGHAVRAENGFYTSQFIAQISDELNGTTVVCAHDNGSYRFLRDIAFALAMHAEYHSR